MNTLAKLSEINLNELETIATLKASLQANKALAELKGLALTIPNEYMLISTLALQEAKASSEIENIITTHDELYKSNYQTQYFTSINAKEVHNYNQALKVGYDKVLQTELLTCNTIIDIQQTLEENNAGFRTQMGTQLKNEHTGKVIYTPPQNIDDITVLMSDLERFMNDDSYSNIDDLIKMAIIHHQFESIHPFYDGNGRTGRIINILFLVKQNLLSTPILYLSRYINHHKQEYYYLLQAVRDNNDWEKWILFMLEGVRITAIQTQAVILEIKKLMAKFKTTIKANEPNLYSHELINNLFSYPYTKVDFIANDLGVHRNTAIKYLNKLVNLQLLEKHKLGKENFYINTELFQLLEKGYHME